MSSDKVSVHGSWASRWVFIFAATGSAVGLGSIWKFPYMVGVYGGGAFVLVFLACIALIGLPVMLAETLIGRRARQAPANALKVLALEAGHSAKWSWGAFAGMITALLILSFYSVVGGWSLDYIVDMGRGDFQGATADQVGAVVGTLKGIFADPTKLATQENYDKAIDGVQGLLKPGESKNVPEEIEAFRKAFDDLLKQADVKQLIVLIDDLDRCLPDTAIETLEAVRLFVFTARTAFIVAADEAMIEYSVRKHFPELPDTTGPRDYARNYLEKLIQIPFRIPALGETETRIYVTLLLIGAELGEDDPAYSALITVARELLKRPWQTAGLDAQTVKTALGDKAGQVQNALTLSDQIGPILASGTQGNPRQIKRFLNTLLLRHQTALARGFGDDVKLPVLAKLMLAERFLSRLFDQIASAAARDPDGRCVDLAALEAAASEEKPAAKAKRTGSKISSVDDAKPTTVPDSKDSAILTEWKAADAIRAWAQLSPALAEVDLRPYLFVTKDRKDYFGAASVLGRLAAVVEKLLGPKLAVQAFEGELKQLVPAEAAQVFEELRGRVMGGDAFDTAPPGVDGLAVLVRAHPTLQANLLDLLEALPADRCGPWPASGWEGIIKDTDAVARFEKLLQRWSTSQSTFLKTTAGAALRTRKGGR